MLLVQHSGTLKISIESEDVYFHNQYHVKKAYILS